MRRKVTYVGLKNAIVVAALFVFLYLLVVIVTTPSLSPFDALAIAAKVNGITITAMIIGIGIQSFLASYSERVSCKRKTARAAEGISVIGSTFSSFLSFFTLVPLGCCGTWLYIISFLPGLLGVGISATIIRYSSALSLSGIAMMGVSIINTFIAIKRAKHRVAVDGKVRGGGPIPVLATSGKDLEINFVLEIQNKFMRPLLQERLARRAA